MFMTTSVGEILSFSLRPTYASKVDTGLWRKIARVSNRILKNISQHDEENKHEAIKHA